MFTVTVILLVAGVAGLGFAGTKLVQHARKHWRRKRRHTRRREMISFIIPFRTDNGRRAETWGWLARFYRDYFPDAEFIISSNNDRPFCKTKAVNDGFKR